MNTPKNIITTTTTIRGEELILHPSKVIYYPNENALIISDAHLGKADHFRKSGIPVPEGVNKTNLDKIESLINEFNPERIIFLGDLFHSSLNIAWTTFNNLINQFPNKVFELVKGNHDILPDEVYKSSSLIIVDELILGPFMLTHIPLDRKSELYNLAGHIHPGISLKGKAKQYLKLPCFVFNKWQGILPAFGDFTGLFKMNPQEWDQIFGVSSDSVKKLK